jgi:hypothetical protein
MKTIHLMLPGINQGESMQKFRGLKIVMPIMAMLLSLSIVACVSMREGNRADIENMLKASGFKMGVADTAEKLDQLKDLPQRKVVPYEEGGKTFYIYADVEKCKCAYAGDEEAFKKYQKLSHKKQASEEDRRESLRNQRRETETDDGWSFDKGW